MGTFARHAEIANKRNKATLMRSAKTREIMRKNKRAAARALHRATAIQQRALAALDAQTNSKIRQTNSHIAANAAQIKANAKKARDELHKACYSFDKKMFHAREESKKGRSKLAATSRNMNKRLRAMISGKIKAIAADTAAQFHKVRATMARYRAHADMMLKHATTRMSASLNAMKVLQNKRFASTISNISKMRAENNARIAKAKSFFKVNIMHLTSVVKHQVTKLNGRVTQLQGVVTKNRLEQARVNRNVNAEIKRMVKLGNKREMQLANNDKALCSLMAKNRASTNSKMMRLANNFRQRLSSIKRTMKRDRRHAERMLNKKTAGLYKTLLRNAKIQAAANQKLTEATRRARLDAADALRNSMKMFLKRLAGLHATVVKNDRKADAKIKRLAGISTRNALKDARGRQMLRMMAAANKAELKTAVRQMIHKGEMHALAVEKRVRTMNKKTRASMNMKITNQISALAKKTHASIEDLRLNSKAARAAMKREILYAVRSAAALVKRNLKKTVQWANKNFVKLNTRLSRANAANAAGRAALERATKSEKRRAMRAVKDAVSNQNRALLALKTETAKKISKTNRSVDAYAAQLKKNTARVNAQMKANVKSLLNKINAAKIAAKKGITRMNAASVARHRASLKTIAASLRQARAAADRKFGKAYERMAADRAASDRKLARETSAVTAAIAKRSALYDARFSKTVKNMARARRAAYLQVQAAKKGFTTQLAGIISSVKDQETRLQGEIAVVSAEVVANKAQQVRINRKLDAEKRRIQKIMDSRHSTSMKWRGRFRSLISEHRAVAKAERRKLATKADGQLRKLRSRIARNRRQAASDLTKATQRLYSTMSAAQARQARRFKGLKGALAKARMSAARALKRTKSDFQAKITTLSNTVTANNRKFEIGLQRVTKVVHSFKKASAGDRKNLRDQIQAMRQDTNKANISSAQKALQGEISERLEVMADGVYKGISENRGKIADNYLALKAYCGANAGAIIDYTTKNSGRGLSSVGDFLTTVAALSGLHTKPAEGPGAGGKSVMPLFGGKEISVATSWSKTNGLCNEYTKAMTTVRQRWPLGLGHYLLGKVQFSMQKNGLLTVGKIAGKSGQMVFVNGHAIGLSNKLADFDKLVCRAKDYQTFLHGLAKALPKKKKISGKKKYFAPPPEWSGK